MKKHILIALLAMGVLAPAISFGQEKPAKKEAPKKEAKMDKKEGKMSKGKGTKAKETKMEKK